MKDNDSTYAATKARLGDAPTKPDSLTRGFLVGLGAIAAGLAAMAALQFLAFNVIGQREPLALIPALLSLPCVPIALALLAVHYLRGRRASSAWGVLLAAAVSLALLVAWISLPAGIRAPFATAAGAESS